METGFALSQIDTTTPHPGRMYDALLGGKDNYAAEAPGTRVAYVDNDYYKSGCAHALGCLDCSKRAQEAERSEREPPGESRLGGCRAGCRRRAPSACLCGAPARLLGVAFRCAYPKDGGANSPVKENIMIVAFALTPLGVGEDVSEPVAEAVRVVRRSGLPNHTDAMFTIIEGEWDEVMGVVKQAIDAVAAVAPRVSMVLKADIRPGVTDGLTSKVEALESYLSDTA